MSLQLNALVGGGSVGNGVPLLLVSLVYCIIRAAGKYCGAFWGSVAAGKGARTRKYLGLALIPQASVAIGLVEIGAQALSGLAGEILTTVVLTSGVMYELVGPVCTKFALQRAGDFEPESVSVMGPRGEAVENPVK